MTDDNELFPGFNKRLETAVQAAVTSALADIDTVSLKRCQEKLTDALQRMAQAETRAEVWQELAARRKRDIESMQTRIDELTFRVAALESVIDNHNQASNEVTAGDDERFNE